MYLDGRNLIFLLSQPRSGSTLLQRILGAHPQIFTSPEPWIMLHPAYAFSADGHQAEYNAKAALRASQAFMDSIPNSQELYLNGIRNTYLQLYDAARTPKNAMYFLDKTPRYYFIVNELQSLFPRAKFIILFRNPIAVLSSIFNTWGQETWNSIYKYRDDLLKAPHCLIDGSHSTSSQSIVVQYEDLTSNPHLTIKKCCEFLELDFVPDMINYGKYNFPKSYFGDIKEINSQNQPTAKNEAKWKQNLAEPQFWRFARDYVAMLGPSVIEKMGYSNTEIRQTLNQYQPAKFRLLTTASLPWLLVERIDPFSIKKVITWILHRYRKVGLWITVISIFRRAFDKK